MQAADLHIGFLEVKRNDSYGSIKRLHDQVRSTYELAKMFHVQFAETLPAPASDAIHGYIDQEGPIIALLSGNQELDQEKVWAGLIGLSVLETAVSFALSDVQQTIRARPERCFTHLQRTIVVDRSTRERWVRAFEAGERECEKLGAVHLLQHGIYAFKSLDILNVQRLICLRNDDRIISLQFEYGEILRLYPCIGS